MEGPNHRASGPNTSSQEQSLEFSSGTASDDARLDMASSSNAFHDEGNFVAGQGDREGITGERDKQHSFPSFHGMSHMQSDSFGIGGTLRHPQAATSTNHASAYSGEQASSHFQPFQPVAATVDRYGGDSRQSHGRLAADGVDGLLDIC